jgi:hypothetical protein
MHPSLHVFFACISTDFYTKSCEFIETQRTSNMRILVSQTSGLYLKMDNYKCPK